MSEKQSRADGLVRIGELARQAGTSLSTVKYYVKEGLIRPACKTGRNMAYYEPACADVIRLIRTLQKERYYPLSVIRKLLETMPPDQLDLELLDAIHKVDGGGAGGVRTAAEAARTTGLTAAQIAALQEAGLIALRSEGRRQVYGGEDLELMELVRRRLEAGIPLEQSIRALSIYDRALDRAAREDVDAFTLGVLMAPDGGREAQAGARMIRVSDETLDDFVRLRRRSYNRLYGSRRLEQLEAFAAALARALAALPALLTAAGQPEAAGQCEAMAAGRPTGLPALDEAAARYRSIDAAGGDIAWSIVCCARSRDYFSVLDPETAGDGKVAACCLKAAWLCLAPEILGCGRWAQEARETLLAAAPWTNPARAALAQLLERGEEHP